MGATDVSRPVGAHALRLEPARGAGVRPSARRAPRRFRLPRLARGTLLAIAGCVASAGVSLLFPIAPGYDPWSWLLWGREVTRLELSTAEGPAFKPLPVAVAALLSPSGAAPGLWLFVARLGALAAVVLAFVAARRLAGGGRRGALAGGAAAVGVALTDSFLVHGAVGNAEPLFVALVLGSFAAALDGRHRPALALGGLGALLRPECWPFLAAYAAWRASVDPRLRAPLLLGGLAVAAAWLVPEWLASGEPLRSAGRALKSTAGAPALAERPALAALSAAGASLFVPTALAVAAVRGRAALLPAAAGCAWVVLVALMAEAGFSGEERYSLPGVALVAVSGGVGVARLASLVAARKGETLAVATVGALALAAVPFTVARVDATLGLAPRLADEAALASALPDAIERAGGRRRLLACGPPAVGRFRGPLLAYHLYVEKRRVRADGRPSRVTFRSSRTRGGAFAPRSPAGARVLATHGRWRIETACSIWRAD